MFTGHFQTVVKEVMTRYQIGVEQLLSDHKLEDQLVTKDWNLYHFLGLF